MGGRRFHPQRQTGQRRNAERQSSSLQPKPGGHSHTHSHGGNSIQRVVQLQSLLGNYTVSKLLEKKPDPESNPSVREAFMKLSRDTFERVIDRLPSLFGPASQLLAIPVPGQEAGQAGAVSTIGATLMGLLTELDLGIHHFEKAGGELTDIEPIIAIRAQLSSALFYLQQMQSGAQLGARLLQCVQEANIEGLKYRAELVVKKAVSESTGLEEGPRTLQQQQKIDVKVLQLRALFLGAPGMFATTRG